MEHTERRKFLTNKDWFDYLGEKKKEEGGLTGAQLRELRRACYQDIEEIRERPLLVYASGFIGGAPDGAPVSINLEDIDGFIDLVSSVHEHDSVDVLIHSPGGMPDATERIVNLLRQNFAEVNFLVPHSAYSAATMMALSGNEIVLHPSATLGPIDPQVGGIPARQIIRGFEKARDLLEGKGPEALPAYIPLLQKYSLEKLEACRDAEELSENLATEWLGEYMFDGDGDEEVIKEAVAYFANQKEHKTHSRPLVFNKINELGLNIKLAESPLAELMREAYILLNGFFGATDFIKLFEDSQDLSWGKKFGRTRAPEQQGERPPASD